MYFPESFDHRELKGKKTSSLMERFSSDLLLDCERLKKFGTEHISRLSDAMALVTHVGGFPGS